MPNINKDISIGYKSVDRQHDFIFPFDAPASPAELDANTAELQRAIDFAEEKGNKLIFDRETYTFSHTIFLGDNAWIDFNGSTIIFSSGSAPTPTDLFTKASFISNKSHSATNRADWNKNIKIENGNFDTIPAKGNIVGFAHAEHIEIKNLTGLENIYWHLVDLAGVEDVKVHHCQAYCTRSVAYQVDNLTGAGGLVVELPDHTMVELTVDGTNSSRIHFYENLADGGPNGNGSHAFHLHRDGGSDIYIYRNTIKNYLHGVYIDADSFWDNVKIESNTFIPLETQTGRCGIRSLGDVSNLLIKNNTFKGEFSDIVNLDTTQSASTDQIFNVEITSNTVDTIFRHFVNIKRYTNYIIANNNVMHANTRFTGVPDATNSISDQNNSAINIEQCKNGSINNNRIVKTNLILIRYNNSDQILISDNNVNDFANIINCDGTGGQALNINLRNNTFVPESGYCYYFVTNTGASNAAKNRFFRIYSNTFARCKQYGFHFDFSNNIYMGDNVLSGIDAPAMFYMKDTNDVVFTSRSNNFNTDNYIIFDGTTTNVAGFIDVWDHSNGVGDTSLGGTQSAIYLHSPIVSVSGWFGTDLPLTSGVYGKLIWDGKSMDQSNCLDMTGTGLYTAKVSGWYSIKANVTLRNNIPAGARITIALHVDNNPSKIRSNDTHTGVNGWITAHFNEVIYLRSGQTFDIRVRQISGTTVSVYNDRGHTNLNVKMLDYYK